LKDLRIYPLGGDTMQINGIEKKNGRFRQLTKIVSLGRFLPMPTCVHEYRDPGLFYVVFGLVFRSRYASNHIKSNAVTAAEIS
jgi:hypothetical protein